MSVDKHNFPPELQLMIKQYCADRRELEILHGASDALAKITSIVPALSMVAGAEFSVQRQNKSEDMSLRNDMLFNALLRQGFIPDEIPEFLDRIYSVTSQPHPAP